MGDDKTLRDAVAEAARLQLYRHSHLDAVAMVDAIAAGVDAGIPAMARALYQAGGLTWPGDEVEALRKGSDYWNRRFAEEYQRATAADAECDTLRARVCKLESERDRAVEMRNRAMSADAVAAEDHLESAAETLECAPDQVPEQVRRLADECRRATEAAESGCMPEVMAVVEACEAPGVTDVMKGRLYRTLGDLVEAVRSGKRCGVMHPTTVELLRAAREWASAETEEGCRKTHPSLKERIEEWHEANCPDLPPGEEGGGV